MTVVFYLLLLAALLPWVNSSINRFTLPTKELLSFDKAKSKCMSFDNQWNLPDFQQHVDGLLAYVKEESLTSVWLLIQKVSFVSWTWINGTAEKQNIYQNQGYMCGGLAVQTQKLRPMNCAEDGLGFICQVPAGNGCPREYYTQNCFSIGDTTYTIGCRSNNWFDARSHCMRQGGDLAVVQMLDIQQKLFQHITDRKIYETCTWFYVGLRKEDWLIRTNKGNIIPKRTEWDHGQPIYGTAMCSQLVLREATYVWITKECESVGQVVCQNYENVTKVDHRITTIQEKSSTTCWSNSNCAGIIPRPWFVIILIMAVSFFLSTVVLGVLCCKRRCRNVQQVSERLNQTSQQKNDEYQPFQRNNDNNDTKMNKVPIKYPDAENEETPFFQNIADELNTDAPSRGTTGDVPTEDSSSAGTDVDMAASYITVVLFTTGVDPDTHSLKGVIVENRERPGKPCVDKAGTKVAEIVADSFKMLTDDRTKLRIININATDPDGKLHDEHAKEILEWLHNDDSSTPLAHVVYLPQFDDQVFYQVRVLSLLKNLKDKMVLVANASLQPQLPDCEVIAVGVYKDRKYNLSTTIDLAVNLPSRTTSTADDTGVFTYTTKDTYYGPSIVCGLFAAVLQEKRLNDSRTRRLRDALLQNVNRRNESHSLYWGYGTLKAESLRIVAKGMLESLKNNTDELLDEAEMEIPTPEHLVSQDTERNWDFSKLNDKKVKVGIIRSGFYDYNEPAYQGWNISIYPPYRERWENKDRESHPTNKDMLIMLKALQGSGMDINILKRVVEITDYPLVDEGWRMHDWKEFKDVLTKPSCDIMHLPSIEVPPSEEDSVYTKTADLRKSCILLTSAVAMSKHYVLPIYPAQCVIAVGCKEKAGQRKQREKDSRYSSMSKSSSSAHQALGKSRSFLERQKSLGEIGWQSWGSTLDFVCEGWAEETPKDQHNPWSASYYAVGIAALVIVKAYALGFENSTIEKLRSTFVMQSILRQMCKHKKTHEIEDGWGELEPWKILNDPTRLYDIVQKYTGENAPLFYWNGKNIN